MRAGWASAADRPRVQAFDFKHDQHTYEVVRGGSGPAVLVLPEIHGLHPGVIDFARRLIAAGYTVYLPSLFGRPAASANGREIVRSILRVCVAREFTKLADRTSPVVGWLRALAASTYREWGGPGVGVVGMCFTGGFALATALEPSVLASVMSQPAVRPSSVLPMAGERQLHRHTVPRDSCDPGARRRIPVAAPRA